MAYNTVNLSELNTIASTIGANRSDYMNVEGITHIFSFCT